MLLTDSTSLTDNRVVYSAGAYKHGSTKPWGLLVTPSEVSWEDETNSGRIFHSIKRSDATNPAIPITGLVRIACHILVDRLPDTALIGLVESLRSIYEFYREPLRLPSPPSAAVTFAAKFGGSYVRPTIAIEEEE